MSDVAMPPPGTPGEPWVRALRRLEAALSHTAPDEPGYEETVALYVRLHGAVMRGAQRSGEDLRQAIADWCSALENRRGFSLDALIGWAQRLAPLLSLAASLWQGSALPAGLLAMLNAAAPERPRPVPEDPR